MARGAEELAADNAAVVARLSTALENPALSDLVLLSERDGTKTPAAALILAIFSPVFTTMLTGVFAEGAGRGRKRSRDDDTSAPSVSCALSGDAAAAIVTFAATNDAPALWNGSAEFLFEMLEASEYCDIDGLRVKAKSQLLVRAREVPEEACEVLEAVWGRWATDEFGAGLAGEFARESLDAIECSADVSLMGCGCLCEEAMEKVLVVLVSSQSIGTEDADLFRAIQKWVSVDETNRKSVGVRLVSCVSFELMPPTFLKEVVAKSGFVAKDVLFDIYEALAVNAEISLGLNTPDGRTLPNWYKSGSAEFTYPDVDDGDPRVGLLDRTLHSGRWSWEIRIERICDDFEAGLVFTEGVLDIDSSGWLGGHEYGYVYDRSGAFYGGCNIVSYVAPEFGQGDTICLTLDCEAGSLTARVNDGLSISMNFKVSGVEKSVKVKSFTPAVALWPGARARLPSFSRVPS